jgi:hypothetical protein
MTQPSTWPSLDFSRLPTSAHEFWQRLVSSQTIQRVLELNLTPEQDAHLAAQLGGAAGKSASIIAAAGLDDGQDQALAAMLGPVIDVAKRVAAQAEGQ